MRQVLNILEAVQLTSIEGVSDFIYPQHEQGKIYYPKGSRSLKIGKDRDSPLAQVHEDRIQLGTNSFQLGKREGIIGNPYIHHALSYILGNFPGEVSLNHMGMCINVHNIEGTIKSVIEGYRGSVHQVFEDPVGRDEDMRWLFIGDPESGHPMFELVLPNPHLNMRNHFQIDIDTNVPQEQIQTYFQKTCGKDFFDWQLTIPEIGTVLHMGTLQTCNTYDIRLGVGNNRRNREIHRKTMELIT